MTTSNKAEHHEGHGLGFYGAIFGVLLVLTAATVFQAKALDAYMGQATRIVVALVIASVKAYLVIQYFMHLGEHGGTNKAYLAACFFFVFLMLALILGDVATRNPAVNPNQPKYQQLKGAW